MFLFNTNYQYAMTSNFSGFQVNPAYPNVIFVYNLRPGPSPVLVFVARRIALAIVVVAASSW